MFRRAASFFAGHTTRRAALTFEQAAQRNEQLENAIFKKTNAVREIISVVMNFHHSTAELAELIGRYGNKLTISDVCDMHVQLLRHNVNSNNNCEVANRMEIVKLVVDKMQGANFNGPRK